MSSKRKRRVPQCARCRSHNTYASVRGHKRQCQWKDCTCPKCLMVTEKRRITAVRVAVLRRERKRRMSHRMAFDPFHAGLHGASPWGMMGRVPGTHIAEQFHDNRRMLAVDEPYYNEMLHMKYREMYQHYENVYRHIHPRDCLPCREEPTKTDSGITQNLESFQHEYESFMRKLHDDEMSPSNRTEVTSPRYSPGPQRICIRPTSPHSHVDIYRSPVTSGDRFQPGLSYENHRYLPMMLNTPLTLTCPCPKSPEFACSSQMRPNVPSEFGNLPDVGGLQTKLHL